MWGISADKVQDILGAGRPAQRELNKAQRQAEVLREAGLNKEADKILNKETLPREKQDKTLSILHCL